MKILPPSSVSIKTPTGQAAVSRLAFWLDAGIRVPGTNLRFGLDPILGLVPGLGDAAGAILAGWILVEATRLGASRATILRMAGNVAFDALVGAVPVVGDVFDFVWKANLRNVALLERHRVEPSGAARADRAFVVLIISGIVALALGLLALGVVLTRWVVRGLGLGGA